MRPRQSVPLHAAGRREFRIPVEYDGLLIWRANGIAEWTQADKEGGHVWDEHPLSEIGRRKLLQKFGLLAVKDNLPLDRLRYTSPSELQDIRRVLELTNNPVLSRHEVFVVDAANCEKVYAALVK